MHFLLISLSVVLSTICIISFPSNLAAETPAEAMSAFGLIGTWSPDCATEEDGIERTTYSAAMLSSPTVLVSVRQKCCGVTKLEARIISAVRVTDEKIRLTAVKTKRIDEGGGELNVKPMTWQPKPHEETVLYERSGKRIRMMDAKVETDGKKKQLAKDGRKLIYAPNESIHGFFWSGPHLDTVSMEKCLN